MSVVTITIIIVAIIGVCVFGIYVAQARERARIEKIQKIKLYSDRYQRLQRLLHELPPQYVSNELRVLIVTQSMDALKRLLSLKNDNRYEAYLQEDQDYLDQLNNKKLSLPPVNVNTPEKALEVRSLLEVLFKFVQQQAKQGVIDPGRAKQYLLQIKFGVAKSKADGLTAKAAQATINGKPRVAIHAYHSAIEAFKSIADYPKAAEAIAHYRAEIKKLEASADEHNQKVKEKAEPEGPETSEWNEFLGDDDEWKKKNAYDD